MSEIRSLLLNPNINLAPVLQYDFDKTFTQNYSVNKEFS